MLLWGHTSSLKKERSGLMVNSWCLQFLDVTMLLQVVLAGTIDEMARIEVFVNPIAFMAPTRLDVVLMLSHGGYGSLLHKE